MQINSFAELRKVAQSIRGIPGELDSVRNNLWANSDYKESVPLNQKNFVRCGIRTHAHIRGPEYSSKGSLLSLSLAP